MATKIMSELELKAPEIMRLVVQQALDGCIQSQKLIIERIEPLSRPVYAPVVIRAFPHDGTPLDKANAILSAMAKGKLSPSIGALMIQSLQASCNIEEFTKLVVEFREFKAAIEERKK